MLIIATSLMASINALSVTVGGVKVVATALPEAAKVEAALIPHPMRKPNILESRDHDPRRALHGKVRHRHKAGKSHGGDKMKK